MHLFIADAYLNKKWIVELQQHVHITIMYNKTIPRIHLNRLN